MIKIVRFFVSVILLCLNFNVTMLWNVELTRYNDTNLYKIHMDMLKNYSPNKQLRLNKKYIKKLPATNEIIYVMQSSNARGRFILKQTCNLINIYIFKCFFKFKSPISQLLNLIKKKKNCISKILKTENHKIF